MSDRIIDINFQRIGGTYQEPYTFFTFDITARNYLNLDPLIET